MRSKFEIGVVMVGLWSAIALPARPLTAAAPSGTGGARAAASSTSGPLTSAAAHELGQSYIFLRIHDDSIVVRLEITAADLDRALDFGWPSDGRPTDGQLATRIDSIRAYAERHFALSTEAGPLPLRFRDYETRFTDVAEYVLLTYVIDGRDEIPDLVDVRYSVMFEVDQDHRNFLVIEHNWRTSTFNNEAVISLIFSPGNPEQGLDLSQSSLLRGFIGFIWLGVWHIWIGTDHILFLVALVLPAVLWRRDDRWAPVPSFKTALLNIVTIVTFFTIAHSVTLSLAALDLVRLPSRLVESIIAGSIAAAAAANLFPRLNVKEAAIAFLFGLFHGFGFATVLGEIGMGREHLVLSLLGFNVGVELGQVAIIVAIFPALYLVRKSKLYVPFMFIGSLGLIGVGGLWLLERTFEFNIPLVATARGVLSWFVGLF
jgi:hypothetical protein